MRLIRIQEALTERTVPFEYSEEDGCGSLDFLFRGIPYHIWEFRDGDTYGVETNIFNPGRSVDIEGDYEEKIAELISGWPLMLC
ncbi:MAG: kinase [Lachnospiraceae bacterium]|nr:kinase [Lachnospiraceae bacterium]